MARRIYVVINTTTGEPLRAFTTEEAAMEYEDAQWEKDPENYESQIYPIGLQD